MENFENPQSLENQGRDVTAEFMNPDDNFNFHSFLRSVRSEPLLKIRADLTETKDQREFVFIARRAKAFLEATKPEGQQRNAFIRCTKSQMAWEPNVFSSGVEWEKAEESD